MANAPSLEDRIIAVALPGSAWLDILTSHVDWVITDFDVIAPEDRQRTARHIRLLYAAVVDGAPASLDDLVTEARDLVETTCEMLGYPKADNEDTWLAARLITRQEVLQSLIKKLVVMAGTHSPPRTT